MSNDVQTTPDPLATGVIQPSTAEEAAAAMKRASDTGLSMLIRGAGTKIDWGRPAARIDVVLDMRRLNRVLAHAHGDLTATVEAGATLRDVNDALSRLGQALPLDPPFADEATIGGILATNDSGSLRHRHGAPRDLVLGVQLATTDGILSKAGGQVVKNVAGYDLSKLVAGSFGSLAAIISATFKLSPIPEASKTVRVTVADEASLAQTVRSVMASQLEPIAFEIHVRSTQNTQTRNVSASPASSALRPLESLGVAPSKVEGREPQGIPSLSRDAFIVLLRFASLPKVVDAQVAAASEALKGLATSINVVDGDAEPTLWRAHATQLWNGPGAIVRASWLPASIAALLGELPPGAEMIGRAAIGAGLVRIDGDDSEQARVIAQLRHSPHAGNVVVRRGSAGLKALADVWGPQGDRERLLSSMKRAFDPNGVLNAGRGPL
jgi:glycolate dehydrogenase FAD-binding subunit